MAFAMEISTMGQAMQLHARVLKSGPENQAHAQNLSKLFTFSALSPTGDLTYARHILTTLQTPNSYYYNTMIRAYSDSPDPTRSLSLFLSMHCREEPIVPGPDKFTYPFVLKACSKLRYAQLGKQIHGLILKSGLMSDRYVNNALIHMYAGCVDSGLALKMFDEMSDRDVVSWTSMIDGFVDNDRPIEAIGLFEQMMDNGVDPNEATLVSVLRACADTGAMSIGQKVHNFVKERNLSTKANVGTALIDMYAKCGCIESAKEVFNETMDKDVYAWTAMVSGLASHGLSEEAMEHFEQMKSCNVKPDERTMTAVLSACRNAGWIGKGLYHLRSMKKYKLRPTIQHYGCIVDTFVRAGQLEEAEQFIRKMPIDPDVVLWRTLLWGCKTHGDVERSERLVKDIELLKMDSHDCGSYILLGNVYAAAGNWKEKAKMRELMNQRGLVKTPGSSRIEIDGLVHEFTAGDSRHVEAENIFAKLDEMEQNARREGYDPKVSEVLLEIDDDEKASQLLKHSEKLAVSFGLIKTNPGTVIRVVKNLRSCEDCHSFMKLISKLYQREIIIRDRIRYHHFRGGECSCGDRW
ncbi:pentatricopeptide repeat-containing protein At5g66520-like [Nicotiana tabacum]|uniref:Pentatricopeptide repeat-containing protein At4g21065-like n=1 Tax=Nicotiana tabacum TaxID=4097 RepID=A0A1S4DQR7_TOBAC|nr:pentatricopeptide repeat-containing protein At4g21065-like [Nicotiana tomentosiformis]XP_016515474.1 PREDICTED: pentatricopeptide repeat-containing protein At4g21065-like [Nicotiana tabacum]